MKRTEAQKRLDREHAQFVKNRAGKGKARVQVRKVASVAKDGLRVRGNAIIVEPKTFSRDAVKAFKHFCQQQGIALSPVETITCTPPGVAPFDRVIAWLAIGEVQALELLIEHSYVGEGQWYFATDTRVIGMTTLAMPKRKAVKDSDIPAHPHAAALTKAGMHTGESYN